ncbi:hypothetical protein [Nocardia arizonensis]|uniref:hypothetical protein n=1 Tax=Nocardia arizonensis TaxID=1141647 RepID=UPI0006D0D6F0|nr:hypothetical protein [Nocardia arizonensis]
MTFWLTALLVWVAAGARVGRVLVKPATTARVAIVVAVSAVAAAVTVSVPEIGVAVNNLAPDGVAAGRLSDGVVTAAWLLFATATSVVAAAAWPVVSRLDLRRIGAVIYGFGALTALLTLFWSFAFGSAVTALSCGFVVVTGLRNLDWTALGRGIAIYTTGTSVVGVLSMWQVHRILSGMPLSEPRDSDWAWPAWEVAALLIAAGAMWVVIELWVRARVLLRRIRPLHRMMIGRFPEAVTHERPSTSTQLAASDHVAQIMDALYLQCGGIVSAATPPASVRERADLVADWARNPLGDIALDVRWIAPPAGVSARGWVGAIAHAFRTGGTVTEKSATS